MAKSLKFMSLLLVANMALAQSTSILAITTEPFEAIEVASEVLENVEKPHDFLENELASDDSEMEASMILPELTLEGPNTLFVDETITLKLKSSQELRENVVIHLSPGLQLKGAQAGISEKRAEHRLDILRERVNQTGTLMIDLVAVDWGKNEVIATSTVEGAEVSSSVLLIDVRDSFEAEAEVTDEVDLSQEESEVSEEAGIEVTQTLNVKQNDQAIVTDSANQLSLADQLAYELIIPITEAARGTDKLLVKLVLPEITAYQEGSLVVNGQPFSQVSVSDEGLSIEVTELEGEQLSMSFETEVAELIVGEYHLTSTVQLVTADQIKQESILRQKVGSYAEPVQNNSNANAQIENIDFIPGQLNSYIGNEISAAQIEEGGRFSRRSSNARIFIHKGQRFEVNLHFGLPHTVGVNGKWDTPIEHPEIIFSDDVNNRGTYVPDSLRIDGVRMPDSKLTVFNDPLMGGVKAYSFDYGAEYGAYTPGEEIIVTYEVDGTVHNGSTRFYMRDKNLPLTVVTNLARSAFWSIMDQVIDGPLQFETIEEDFDFGSHERTFGEQWLGRKESLFNDYDSGVFVLDQRKNQSDGWKVTANIVEELSSGGQSLGEVLMFIPEGGATTDAIELSAEPVVIHTQGGTGVVGIKRYGISWTQDTGILMRLKKSDQNTGAYQGQIKWSLSAGP